MISCSIPTRGSIMHFASSCHKRSSTAVIPIIMPLAGILTLMCRLCFLQAIVLSISYVAPFASLCCTIDRTLPNVLFAPLRLSVPRLTGLFRTCCCALAPFSCATCRTLSERAISVLRPTRLFSAYVVLRPMRLFSALFMLFCVLRDSSRRYLFCVLRDSSRCYLFYDL